MNEKAPINPPAENSNCEELVMKIDNEEEISEEQMNELIDLTKGIANIAAVMNKFTSVMGGLKEMLGNLTEKVSMLEEEISQLPEQDKEPMRFEIDENEAINIKEAIKKAENVADHIETDENTDDKGD